MRGPLRQGAHVAYEVGFFLLSLLSRMTNAIFYFGSMHQTLSSRAFIDGMTSAEWAARRDRIDHAARIVTLGYQKTHCAEAWAAEVARARKTLRRNGDL